MTWVQALRYLESGHATRVPVLAGEACRIVEDLGPVEIMRIRFRSGAVFTVTRIVNDPAPADTFQGVRPEVTAIFHACNHPAEPHAELAAAGYYRWVGPGGRVQVWPREPTLDGPWTREPLDRPSRILAAE